MAGPYMYMYMYMCMYVVCMKLQRRLVFVNDLSLIRWSLIVN